MALLNISPFFVEDCFVKMFTIESLLSFFIFTFHCNISFLDSDFVATSSFPFFISRFVAPINTDVRLLVRCQKFVNKNCHENSFISYVCYSWPNSVKKKLPCYIPMSAIQESKTRYRRYSNMRLISHRKSSGWFLHHLFFFQALTKLRDKLVSIRCFNSRFQNNCHFHFVNVVRRTMS